MQPSQPGSANVVQPQRTRRYRVGIPLLIGLTIVLGIAAKNVFPNIEDFQRVSGLNQPVRLTAGKWTVYAENGPPFPPQTIIDSNGDPLPLRPISGRQTYNLGGRNGVAVGQIEVPQTGDFLITTEPGTTTAFGQNFGTDLLLAILLAVTATLSGILSGVFSILAIVRKHQR